VVRILFYIYIYIKKEYISDIARFYVEPPTFIKDDDCGAAFTFLAHSVVVVCGKLSRH
jgi:predicted transcriptional regulator with HTH domain